MSSPKKSNGRKNKLCFTIESLYDNGSGMRYTSKEDFLNELSLMIDDCINNGGSFFDAVIDSNASCFCTVGEYEQKIGFDD